MISGRGPAASGIEARVHHAFGRHVDPVFLQRRKTAVRPVACGRREFQPGHHRDIAPPGVGQMLSDEPTARHVVTGCRWIVARRARHQRELDALRMDLVEKAVIEVSVPVYQPVDATIDHHPRSRPLVLVDVERVGDEGRQAGLRGGFLDAFVDRRQHEVLQPGHQHADQPRPPSAQAGGLRVGGVAVLLRERPDPGDGLGRPPPQRVTAGRGQHAGHRRRADAQLVRDSAQRHRPLL